MCPNIWQLLDSFYTFSSSHLAFQLKKQTQIMNKMLVSKFNMSSNIVLCSVDQSADKTNTDTIKTTRQGRPQKWGQAIKTTRWVTPSHTLKTTTTVTSWWELICWTRFTGSYRLQVQVGLVLLLVGAEPVHGVDVLGVGLVEVGERHHDRSALENKIQKRRERYRTWGMKTLQVT